MLRLRQYVDVRPERGRVQLMRLKREKAEGRDEESNAGLRALVNHLEVRLAHATEFRYGPFVARKEKAWWHVRSDDGSTHVKIAGPEAQDEAIREAARRESGVPR